MRRSVLGAGIFSVVTVATVLHMAPASWFDLVLMHSSGGVVALAGAKGTIWEGSGTLQAVLPGGRPLTLESIRWSSSRLDLLHGEFHLRVFPVRSEQMLADLSLERSGILLKALNLSIPASLLEAFSPTLRHAGLSGTVQIQASDFRLAERAATGTASIVWRNAAASLAGVGTLGSYRIDLTGGTNGLGCRMTTLDATALKLTGTCQMSPGLGFRLDGTAEPTDNALGRLAPVLQVIGRETRPGSFQLQLDRKLVLG